jgi:hypothetical protein
MEGQAFSPLYDMAPPPPLPSVSSAGDHTGNEKEIQLADGRREGERGAESYDPQENLILYN